MKVITERGSLWVATARGLAGVFLAAALALAHPAVAGEPPFSTVTPRDGSGFSAHHPPTFSGRISRAPVDPTSGELAVFVRVSKSAHRNRNGLIGSGAYIDQLRLVGRASLTPLYRKVARRYRYARYWLNRKGTYYWQLYYVNCAKDQATNKSTCYHPGPVRKLRIK